MQISSQLGLNFCSMFGPQSTFVQVRGRSNIAKTIYGGQRSSWNLSNCNTQPCIIRFCWNFVGWCSICPWRKHASKPEPEV